MLNYLKIFAFIVVSLVVQGPHLLAHGIEQPVRFMPKQVRCSSTLFLAKQESTGEPDFFEVDEYVDRVSRRSSLSVYSRSKDENQIYYNQIGPEEKYSGRKFVNYDTAKNSCESKRIGFWPLTILRKVAINVYPQRSELRNIDVDVAVGPSVLLYAIDNNSKLFKYKTTKMSKSRLTRVDVYSRKVDVITVEEYNELEVIVHVIKRGRVDAQVGETLAESVAVHKHFDVASLVACKLRSDDKDDDESNRSDSESMTTPAAIDDHFDDFECKSEDILFQIEFDLVTEHSVESGSSLIGRRLDQQGPYEFHREPFVQPIGIGCWQTGEQQDWQPKLLAASNQFSAEFVTSNGSKGLSFVAYDGYTNTLRLDRFGRKSVYDLIGRKSYHIGQFSAVSERTIITAKEKQELGADIAPMERCVRLEIGEDMYLNEHNTMSRLLGFGNGDFPQHHLGSKTIDHVVYEVFETTVTYMTSFSYNLPILFEHYRYAPKSNIWLENDYYLTYYVRVYPDMVWADKLRLQPDNNLKMMLPEYAELWEYNRKSNSRVLLNRLSFVEFSWSLDVEPVNDPDGQRGSNDLFDIQQCRRERASQADLIFSINWSPSLLKPASFTKDHLRAINANKFYVNEALGKRITSLLGLSRLNLADLQTRTKNDGTIIVKSRIVDLVQGISHEQLLGYASFFEDSDIWYTNILLLYTNRHSINECQLDSLASPEPNWLAYCPKLSLCVLLRQDKMIKQKLEDLEKQKDSTTKPSTNEEELCEIRSFEWIPHRDSQMDPQSGVQIADLNRYKLSGAKYNFSLLMEPTKESDNQQQVVAYSGYGTGVNLQVLDSMGSRVALGGKMLDADMPLVGLRYSTKEEHPEMHNMNKRLRVGDKLDTFKHCQMACQMDDMCASFSVCKRKKIKNSKDECVLSTVRLSSTRLDKLISKSAKRRKEAAFQLKVTSSTESQTMMIYHNDPACSLHPKDLLLEYSIKKTITLMDEPNIDTPQEGQTNKSGGQTVSLEECAGQSHELNAMTAPTESAFTYCPIDSTCLLGDEGQPGHLVKEATKLSKYCYVYKKNFGRFYDSNFMMHMVVTLASPADDKGKSKEATETHLDIANEMERLQLARSYWGLNEESCARDCNLHQSKCLAFDTCRSLDRKLGSRTLCILFSVRSPLSSQAAYLPLLAREQRLREVQKGSTSIASSPFCNHHRLRQGFFEVRLRRMLAEQVDGGDPSDGPFEPSEFSEKLDAIETKILDEDRHVSDLAKGDISDQEASGNAGDSIDPKEANEGLHWLASLVGVTLGALGVLYGKKTMAMAVQLHRSLRTSRGHANDGLAQLVLDDNQL